MKSGMSVVCALLGLQGPLTQSAGAPLPSKSCEGQPWTPILSPLRASRGQCPQQVHIASNIVHRVPPPTGSASQATG